MESKVIYPYHECSSFDKCSASFCPLDPEMDTRVRLTGEEKCKAHKPTRIKIGSKYPELLPLGGLTKREFKGKQRALAYSRLPEAERDRRRELFLQRLQKGQNPIRSSIRKKD